MDDKNLLFENYVSGSLTEKEETDFEKKLQNDSTFKNDFIAYKKVYLFLKHKFENEEKRNQFKRNLEVISNKCVSTSKRKKTNILYYGAVASVLLLIGMFLFKNNTPNYNDFVKYNTIDLVVRSNHNHLFLKAEKAYNHKKFNEAVLYFDEILKQDSNNTEICLHKGFSLIELDKFKKAEQVLAPISKGTSIYKSKATWYLALNSLKQKKYTDCIQYLKLIPKNAEEYKFAKKLMNTMD